ncbi:MAG: hypothetical protein DRI86_16185 [Bacteroidetes bacterium]|nr:MAG: hypothetical protein DRI86_16185 [Bacteroidota bacterium]
MNKSMEQFYFYAQEHPTSVKYNNILLVIDEMRRLTGPISIRRASGGSFSATEYTLALEEDPRYLGGITTSGSDYITRCSFTVWYIEPENEPSSSSYARWENVIFTSGTATSGEWQAVLNSSNLAEGTLGAAGVDLSSVEISGFTCMRDPYNVI